MVTQVSKTASVARKVYSDFLGAQALAAPTPLASLTGSIPRSSDQRSIQSGQSTNFMPIVQVEDLASTAGSRVQIDYVGAVKPKIIMGDRNAIGQGASLEFSSQEIEINMATLPYSAGGKMAQKRTPHKLRMAAINHLATHIPLLRFQRAMVHMAGARGETNGNEWILPTTDDEDFAEYMVNPVLAPTYNRHLVVNGSALERNGSLATIDSTDVFKLGHIDALASHIAEMPIRMLSLRINGDKQALEEPILGILWVDELVMESILTQASPGDIRTFQTNAMQRASYSALQSHPLFAPSTILWRNLLVKKMPLGHSIRFSGGTTVKAVELANRQTALETGIVLPGLSAGQKVARSLLLAGQGLAMALGANASSQTAYTLLEDNSGNYGRNLELAGEFIAGEAKVRAKLKKADGTTELTDYGIIAIDSVVNVPQVD